MLKWREYIFSSIFPNPFSPPVSVMHTHTHAEVAQVHILLRPFSPTRSPPPFSPPVSVTHTHTHTLDHTHTHSVLHTPSDYTDPAKSYQGNVNSHVTSNEYPQVPQYILEDHTERGEGGRCNIVCTQPRRIAAISVAQRVAEERGEPPAGQAGSRVGYHVRLDAGFTPQTRLLFCTTGILLRRMASDPSLSSISHVIVDEVCSPPCCSATAPALALCLDGCLHWAV